MEIYLTLIILILIAIIFMLIIARPNKSTIKKNKNSYVYHQITEETKNPKLITGLPYHKIDYTLNRYQYNSYMALKKICDKNDFLLFSKVELKEIATVTTNQYNYKKWHDYLKNKYIDFIITNNKSLIELAIFVTDINNEDADFSVKILEQFSTPILKISNINDPNLEKNILKIIYQDIY